MSSHALSIRCSSRGKLHYLAVKRSCLLNRCSWKYDSCRPITTAASQTVAAAQSSQLASDSFQLLPDHDKAKSERGFFDAQVSQVSTWWRSPRYKDIKRSYSAQDVASKRGTLQQSYPSSLMARKLFNLLQERASNGDPVHTCMLRTGQSSEAIPLLMHKY